jgi:hypothetical protein
MFHNILLDLDEVNGRVVFLQPLLFFDDCRPSNGKTGLATLYDFSADYQCRYDVSVALYFGWAQGHGVIKAIYPADSNGAWAPGTQQLLLAATLIEIAERPASRSCASSR